MKGYLFNVDEILCHFNDCRKCLHVLFLGIDTDMQSSVECALLKGRGLVTRQKNADDHEVNSEP